jgi:tyrosyl-tRNA synthetase
MSKSLGNYIGIAEPPEIMYRKVMQIADSLMFRYYELLTDRSLAQIDQMRARIAAGELHPMQAKAELARLIVADFHSAAEAARAEEEFNRVVRRHEIPADIETVPLPEGVRTPAGIRVDKLLAKIGLAESVSDAVRKIKAGAVEINDQRVHDLILGGVLADAPAELIVHAGKNWRKVVT